MPVRVLIVLDGGYRFARTAVPPGAPDFTYEALVNTLTGAGMTVTKAHRADDSTATPGFETFRFDALPAGFSLNDIDVIWLIGLNGLSVQGLPGTTGALSDPQINVIANFMDAGGGVFATGDHYSLGAEMSGKIPRVRAMRCWYGTGDGAGSHMPANFPRNFPPLTVERADTTRRRATSNYSEFAGNFVWFENQSDSNPQTITPSTAVAHPILRRGGNNITVYPDHMHEGQTLGEAQLDAIGYDYAQNSPYGDTSQDEFRALAGTLEKPKIIATGQTEENASRGADSPTGEFSFGNLGLPGADAVSSLKTVNTLSTYDGRVVGVGRIVTGATFHHYVDINVTGDSTVLSTYPPPPPVPAPLLNPIQRVGADAQKDHGFNDNAAVFDDIKAVYVNIANWLARPRPAITLYLERSTFGVDEVTGGPHFAGVVRVTVDGLKPSQFPTGPVTTGAFNPAWAPVVTPTGTGIITITPTGVFSDDPTMPERLQRFTFIYDVDFSSTAFGDLTVPVNASFASPAVPAPLTDTAFFQLVTSANPFMLDLENNDTHWLSSDLKVFRVVAGETLHGVPLPVGASRAQAFTFINALKDNITVSQFEGMSGIQATSALSPLPTTTVSGANVYNFALARVRRNGTLLSATNVRVFFRIFNAQTTAALTYNAPGGVPVEGYLKNPGTAPGTNHIALPGQGGGQWLSYPCFSQDRNSNRDDQDDVANVRTIANNDSEEFFGVLLDTNLDVNYLPLTPGGGGGAVSLSTLLTGEHQCLVAQIEFAGTPIPSGSRPSTSDKLAQRNIAYSDVANPGMAASRAAIHTFEIEATPYPITDLLPPDELLLEWSRDIPHGSFARIHIPGWNAEEVVALADRFYPRHELRSVDAHTVEIPGGGMRYIPIPKCIFRQTGVLSVELPLGIRKGQRFDVSVRQITNRGRDIKFPQPKVEQITLAEAGLMLAELGAPAATGATIRKGVFDLGKNRALVTDLSVFDTDGDFALVVQHPDPKKVAAAHADARMWRETLGGFTLAIPVSTKRDMLLYQLRLFSLMSWRLAHMPRNSRWHPTMTHYLALLSDKVQALGGNPWQIPATPDGAIPQLPWVDDDGEGGNGGGGWGDGSSGTGGLFDPKNPFARGCLVGLAAALLLLIALIIIRTLWG